MNVPLLDLKAQFAAIQDEINQAIENVLQSQHFTLGPEVAAMEDEIAAYCQARHCIGVSSGSDALLLAMMALDIGPGDEVITSPYTFFATAGAIHRLGAMPVFVDIEPKTYNIDVGRIEAAITTRTRAIIPVHLYGQMAEMDPIMQLADQYGLAVIEDAAQAIGAEYKGRRAGSIGHINCFSFYPTKNLGACGDGGALTTNDDTLNEKIRCLRTHGAVERYYHTMVGGNFRLDAIQGAILRVKLRSLDRWTQLRQRNADFYTRTLYDLGIAPNGLRTPAVTQSRHVFNQYVVQTPRRDALRNHLVEAGVGCEVYYPVPLHRQKCFAGLGYAEGAMPVAEEAARTTLALPVYPELTADQQEYVLDAITRFCATATTLQRPRAAA